MSLTRLWLWLWLWLWLGVHVPAGRATCLLSSQEGAVVGRRVSSPGPGAVAARRRGAAAVAGAAGRAAGAGTAAAARPGVRPGPPASRLAVPEAVAQVLDLLPAFASDATVLRVRAVLERFIAWCDAHEVVRVGDVDGRLVAAFVRAPLPDGRLPWPATMDGRRAAVRLLFRELREAGEPVGDPTVDVRVPGRVRRGARPLTDEEIALGRRTVRLRSAAGGGYAAVGWALAEAGAISSEIPQIRIVDLDDPEWPRWVRLPGGRRHDAREVELTGWGSAVLRGQVQHLREVGHGDQASLAYRGGAAAGSPASQSAVCTALRSVLLQAGLGEEQDVRPASIRHWAGRSRYDAGMPLEQVACWLGMRSLDATAYDLAIDWRPPAPEPAAARPHEPVDVAPAEADARSAGARPVDGGR